MQNFEDQLKTALSKGIEPIDKHGLKARLMNQLHYKDPFFSKVHSVFSSVRPTVNTKVLMKEKLLTIFELESSNSWSLFPFFRKFSAASMAFVFAFVIVVQPFSGTEVVKASVGTRVVSYSGVVTVVRNGEILNVNKEFVLQPDDLLQTGPAGFVEVVYSDDSISRLGSNTRVLYNEIADSEVEFGVEFSVLEGQVWNNTLGLSTSHSTSFDFVASNVAGQVKIPAVFNIEVHDTQVRVTTLDNSINLLLNDGGEVVPATLAKGQVVTVKKENTYLATIAPETIETSYAELDLDWISSNFTQDELYFKNLTDSKYSLRKSNVGTTPDSLFYPIKKFQRAAKLAFAFDSVTETEIQLSIANQILLEAESLIENEKPEEAKELLAEYTDRMSEIGQLVTDMNTQLDNEAMNERVAELELALKRTLIAQKKSFKEILPTSDVYEVKQAINSAELLVAQTNLDRQKIEIKQAQDVLIEAKQLVKENNTELAEENINKYISAIEKVSDGLSDLPAEEKEVVVTELVESNSTGNALLMAVIQDLNPVETPLDVEVNEDEVSSDIVEIEVLEQPSSNSQVVEPIAEQAESTVPSETDLSLTKTLEDAQSKSLQTITDVIQSVDTEYTNPNLIYELNRVVAPLSSSTTSSGISIQQLSFPTSK